MNILTIIISALIIFRMNSFYEEKIKDPFNESKKIFLIPPIILKHFSFGYNDTMADVFWLRLIQDLGHCEQEKHEDSFNSDGRRMGKNRTPVCEMGWNYHMLHLILELSPRFRMAAVSGPVALSIIADDIAGASRLFKLAIEKFPNDWEILYRAGYHFMMEEEDFAYAADLFLQSAKNGAPDWVPLLVAKLNTKAGRLEMAEYVLKQYGKKYEYDNSEKAKFMQKKIKQKLDAIRKLK